MRDAMPQQQRHAAIAAVQGEEWKKTTLKTALLFPGVVFAIFFMLNLLVWGQRSSGAVPFGTLFALCFLWFGISVPLVFIGSYFGYKKPAPEVRTLMPSNVSQSRVSGDCCLAPPSWISSQMPSASRAPLRPIRQLCSSKAAMLSLHARHSLAERTCD